MSTRAFNQYIDLYFKEHPQPDDETLLKAFIRTETGDPYIISSKDIFTSADNILVLRHPYAANKRSRPHSHDYFELIYLSRGSCTQTINDKSCNMKEGDLCLLNPHDQHRIDIDHPDDLLFNIMIRLSLFKESFLGLIAENDLISNFFLSSIFTMSAQNSYLYFPRHTNSESTSIIHSLIIEFYEQKIGYHKSMECYLALLFTELIRYQKAIIDDHHYAQMGNTQLSEILAYMNLHKADATLSNVAEKFHYNPNYLSTLIKKYTNKSFSEIIQETRLQEASYYLKNTDISIDNMLSLLGYYDRSYFNRVFKKYYGVAPGAYRNAHKKQLT